MKKGGGFHFIASRLFDPNSVCFTGWKCSFYLILTPALYNRDQPGLDSDHTPLSSITISALANGPTSFPKVLHPSTVPA